MKKLVSLIVLCWLASLGCSSVAREQFKHWFFDIPSEAPAEPVVAEIPPPPVSIQRRVVFPEPKFASLHPPYLLRDCRTCHDATQHMQPFEDLEEACGDCHARYFSDEVGHGPAAAGECGECHEMHRSDYLHLLKQPVLDTCVECHEEPEDLSEEVHAEEGVERCTDCHDPHFGSGVFLKPSYADPKSD